MPRIRFVSPEEYDCARDGCDETRTKHTSVEGSYCSRECADRAAGAALLRDLRHDHRFCGTCFRRKKDVETPTDEARRGWSLTIDKSVVGYESPTEHAERGPFGTECECAVVDHDAGIDWVRDSEPYHWYLARAVEYLRERGKRDDSLDVTTLAEQRWAGTDLTLAAGRALRAQSDDPSAIRVR